MVIKLTTSSRLLYLMTFEPNPHSICHVLPAFVQKSQKPVYIRQSSQIHLESEQDRNLFALLSKNQFQLRGETGADILEQLVETERLHFSSFRTPSLKKGKKQQGNLSWITESEGKKKLHCRVMGGANTILPLMPLWYVDHHQHLCGELHTLLEPDIALLLLFSAPMAESQIQVIYDLIKSVPSEKERQKKLKDYLQKLVQPIQEKNIDTWYFNWEALTKNHQSWFDFEMGIEHEGKKINLLPALAELVRTQLSLYPSLSSLSHLPADKVFYIHLPDQKKFAVPVERLKKILSILVELYQEDGLSGHEKLRVSPLRAMQFSGLKDALGIKKLKWYGDTSIKILIRQFEQFRKKSREGFAPLTAPKNFLGKLRVYQQEGIYWLQFLRKTGLSGILADDMGLGKTVQVLVYFLIEKNKNKNKKTKPSLIIAPTSLIMNWAREIARFTPSLKLLILYGQSRKENFDKIGEYDLVVTSYALLLRDEEILVSQNYDLLILDEAQYIKNYTSKAGSIARKISAEQRLCLTGTPMENHLGELWTLFHFLLPGLLGDRRQFQHLFRYPIEKEHSLERLNYLKQRIAPFFLRRTKQEVLKELPDKIDMTRPVLLTPRQHELYENVRVALHQKVMRTIQQRGISKSQIYILEALLKLRQICCDPRLLKLNTQDYSDADSAKLQFLTELLPELISEGRRILLFSQFTQMLQLIEKVLENLNINYLKLTGKTKNRDEIIQRFQSGEIPVFLISLKAGGVGLNLTQADTVIHYDPWWNPAVENQATDRAHRIGQDKTVFVYKLITSGTIEDKMVSLQLEKKSLLDAALSGNGHHFSTLSTDDIEKIFAPLGG